MVRSKTQEASMARKTALLVALFLAMLLPATAGAAAYPAKAIDLIVPWAAGGTSDLTARGLAKALEPILGQPVIVTNVVGAAGAVGHNKVRQSAPDGYTVLFSSVSFLSGYYLGQFPFTWQDFDPLAMLTDEAVVVVVNGSSPLKSLKELLGEMKAKSGQLSWAYAGTGNSTHLVAEGVRMAVGSEFRGVPYDGGSQTRTAILGGHVDAATMTGGEAWAQAQAGKLRILASSLPRKSPSLPNILPLKEQGVNFQFVLWKNLYLPKGTSAEAKDRLSGAIAKAVTNPEFVKLMESIRSDVDYMDHKEFARTLVEEDRSIKELLTKMNLVKK
jgi:tripartite-type tricarboxylate transporter receptor subunit TctC